MIYFIKEKKLVGAKVKIGYTSSDVSTRLRTLQTGSSVDLEIICTIADNNKYNFTESSIHDMFSKYRKRGEWFLYSKQIKQFAKFMNNEGMFIGAIAIEFGVTSFKVSKKDEKGEQWAIPETSMIGHDYSGTHIQKYNLKKGDRYLPVNFVGRRRTGSIELENRKDAERSAMHSLNGYYDYKIKGPKEGPVIIEITKVLHNVILKY